MTQIISLIIIAIITFLIFKNNKEKFSTKKLAILAILITITLVVNMFSLNLLVLGGQVVIRFTQVILILIGFTLGPIYGLIAGFSYDILNLMLNPLGSFHAGFTLNNILVPLFGAYSYKFLNIAKKNTKLVFTTFFVMAYLAYIVSVLSLALLYKNNLELVNFGVIEGVLIASLVIFLVISLLIVLFRNKIKINISEDLLLIMIAAILTELVIQGFLTPLWLYDLAKTPILISMQIRALKGFVLIFINTFIGYLVYKSVLKTLRVDNYVK